MKDSKNESLEYIAVFNELLDKVINEPEKQFILFGKRNFFKSEGHKYSLLFHAIENIPFKNLDTSLSLVAPILTYKKVRSEADAFIYDWNKANPCLDIFGIKKSSEKEVYFYRITTNEKDGYKGIKGLANYFVDRKKLITDIMTNNASKFEKEINESIEEINKKYSPQPSIPQENLKSVTSFIPIIRKKEK